MTMHSDTLANGGGTFDGDKSVTSGYAVSVVDGTVSPAPRPNAVISVGPPGTATDSEADIVIVQTGPQSIEIAAAGSRYEVEMEFFRAENRYVSDLRMVD